MTIDGVNFKTVIRGLIYDPTVKVDSNNEQSEFETLAVDSKITYDEFCEIMGLDKNEPASIELFKTLYGISENEKIDINDTKMNKPSDFPTFIQNAAILVANLYDPKSGEFNELIDIAAEELGISDNKEAKEAFIQLCQYEYMEKIVPEESAYSNVNGSALEKYGLSGENYAKITVKFADGRYGYKLVKADSNTGMPTGNGEPRYFVPNDDGGYDEIQVQALRGTINEALKGKLSVMPGSNSGNNGASEPDSLQSQGSDDSMTPKEIEYNIEYTIDDLPEQYKEFFDNDKYLNSKFKFYKDENGDISLEVVSNYYDGISIKETKTFNSNNEVSDISTTYIVSNTCKYVPPGIVPNEINITGLMEEFSKDTRIADLYASFEITDDEVRLFDSAGNLIATRGNDGTIIYENRSFDTLESLNGTGFYYIIQNEVGDSLPNGIRIEIPAEDPKQVQIISANGTNIGTIIVERFSDEETTFEYSVKITDEQGLKHLAGGKFEGITSYDFPDYLPVTYKNNQDEATFTVEKVEYTAKVDESENKLTVTYINANGEQVEFPSRSGVPGEPGQNSAVTYLVYPNTTGVIDTSISYSFEELNNTIFGIDELIDNLGESAIYTLNIEEENGEIQSYTITSGEYEIKLTLSGDPDQCMYQIVSKKIPCDSSARGIIIRTLYPEGIGSDDVDYSLINTYVGFIPDDVESLEIGYNSETGTLEKVVFEDEQGKEISLSVKDGEPKICEGTDEVVTIVDGEMKIEESYLNTIYNGKIPTALIQSDGTDMCSVVDTDSNFRVMRNNTCIFSFTPDTKSEIEIGEFTGLSDVEGVSNIDSTLQQTLVVEALGSDIHGEKSPVTVNQAVQVGTNYYIIFTVGTDTYEYKFETSEPPVLLSKTDNEGNKQYSCTGLEEALGKEPYKEYFPNGYVIPDVYPDDTYSFKITEPDDMPFPMISAVKPTGDSFIIYPCADFDQDDNDMKELISDLIAKGVTDFKIIDGCLEAKVGENTYKFVMPNDDGAFSKDILSGMKKKMDNEKIDSEFIKDGTLEYIITDEQGNYVGCQYDGQFYPATQEVLEKYLEEVMPGSTANVVNYYHGIHRNDMSVLWGLSEDVRFGYTLGSCSFSELATIVDGKFLISNLTPKNGSLPPYIISTTNHPVLPKETTDYTLSNSSDSTDNAYTLETFLGGENSPTFEWISELTTNRTCSYEVNSDNTIVITFNDEAQTPLPDGIFGEGFGKISCSKGSTITLSLDYNQNIICAQVSSVIHPIFFNQNAQRVYNEAQESGIMPFYTNSPISSMSVWDALAIVKMLENDGYYGDYDTLMAEIEKILKECPPNEVLAFLELCPDKYLQDLSAGAYKRLCDCFSSEIEEIPEQFILNRKIGDDSFTYKMAYGIQQGYGGTTETNYFISFYSFANVPLKGEWGWEGEADGAPSTMAEAFEVCSKGGSFNVEEFINWLYSYPTLSAGSYSDPSVYFVGDQLTFDVKQFIEDFRDMSKDDQEKYLPYMDEVMRAIYEQSVQPQQS